VGRRERVYVCRFACVRDCVSSRGRVDHHRNMFGPRPYSRDSASATHKRLARLSIHPRQRCSLDFCVPYSLPRGGLTLSSQSPPVAASSTPPNRPKSFPPPAQSPPLASSRAQPMARLNNHINNNNNNKRPRPSPTTQQHPHPAPPPNRPPRCPSHSLRLPRR
jgi:hypothetical protein